MIKLELLAVGWLEQDDKSLPWKLKLQQLLRDLVKDKRIKHTVKLWLKLNTHKHIVLLMMLLPPSLLQYFTLTKNNDPYWAKPCLSLALNNTITVKVYFNKLGEIEGSGSYSILIRSLHGSAV